MEKTIESTTEPTKEQAERARDEQTVFGLAALMMEVHTGTLLKNKNQVANAFLKTGVVLHHNPGFVERFRRAQNAIIQQLQKQTRPPGVATLIEAAPPVDEL